MTTPTKWSSVTFGVDTPTGKMYVTILDDVSGAPVEVIIHAGKAGGAVHAWAASLSAVMTSALEQGTKLEELITVLSSQLSDGAPRKNGDGVRIRSGPEGVCWALIQYRRMKYRELQMKLNAYDEDEDDHGRRPARLGR